MAELLAPLAGVDAEAFPAALPHTQTLLAPLVESGATAFTGDVLGDVTPGLVVTSWSRDGTELATLDKSHTRSWEDRLNDTGGFSISVQNDDANYAHTGFDRIIRFALDGVTKWAGTVEQRRVVALAEGEEHDQITTLQGRSTLALLSEAVVYPSRGVGSLPIEDVRSFSWPSPDYDDTGWPAAKQIARHDQWTDHWEASVPRVWPDRTAYFIWADRADCSSDNAPEGTCLFRDPGTFTLATDTTVRIFCAFDNAGQLFVDGAQVVDHDSFVDGQYVELLLSDGDHVIAARVENWVQAVANPGGFICSVYSLDSTGLLDELLLHTDHTWKCLPYVTSEPGFTPGRVLRLLVEDAQADGALDDVTLGFSDTLDSDGNAWDELPEVSVQVGRDLLAVVLELAESLIDVAMAAGAHVLRAWRFGERGTTKAVTLAQGSTVAASDFLSLEHTGRRTRSNALLIRYAGGWTEVTDSTSITAFGRRGEYISLGAIQTEEEAKRIGRQIMARRSEEIYGTTGALHPDASGVPYTDFEPGDTITAPDETGSGATGRVIGVECREDDNGELTWLTDLRDPVEESEIRHNKWLDRMSAGGLAGGSRIVSPAGTTPPTARGIAAVDTAEWSYNGTITVSTDSIARSASVSGNAVELAAGLTTAGSTATTVQVWRNGALFASVTIAAGATTGRTVLDAERVIADQDRFTPLVTTAGTGAKGLDVQVRTI